MITFVMMMIVIIVMTITCLTNIYSKIVTRLLTSQAVSQAILLSLAKQKVLGIDNRLSMMTAARAKYLMIMMIIM